jgi:hypothetical protein
LAELPLSVLPLVEPASVETVSAELASVRP